MNLVGHLKMNHKGEDVDPVNVDMSTPAPIIRPKNDFEKPMLK